MTAPPPNFVCKRCDRVLRPVLLVEERREWPCECPRCERMFAVWDDGQGSGAGVTSAVPRPKPRPSFVSLFPAGAGGYMLAVHP